MWFPLLTLHFIGDQNLLVAMTDGEAWLEALGEQLRESEKQIPALAAAQVKLADADATGVAELQREAATWHAAITSAARAVLGARLSRAAPVMANAVAWASKLQDELSRLEGIMEAEGAPSASSGTARSLFSYQVRCRREPIWRNVWQHGRRMLTVFEGKIESTQRKHCTTE